MTCTRCHVLGLTSTCTLGPHCSCPDGAACGNAVSAPCGCDEGVLRQFGRNIEAAIDREYGTAIECAATAKELAR